MTPSSDATAQPSRPPRSTSTSSGPSSWPATRKPPSRELLELAGRERRPHGAELLAEPRPEHRQVRLHVQLRRLDRAELDLLDAQLVARSRRRAPPASGAPWTTSRRSGWRSLSREAARAWWPSSTTRRTSAISASSASSGARRVRPAGEVDRVGRSRRHAHEVLPEVLGEERHHRRDDAQRLDERVPEHVERGPVAVPEAPPRAADVPVREVVDEASNAPMTSTVRYAS